ncbi:MAG: thioesterase family protein [Desulfovibrio sp.]|jgi:predicted thioesterase|nr:thioesterase family protein [Desulfovibrio sp.]
MNICAANEGGRPLSRTALKPGLTAEREVTVSEPLLAGSVGSGDVAVLATPMMIAGMEAAAAAAVADTLSPGQTTVGARVNVKHLAATPPGMSVRFRAELVAVSPNGKGLSFRVEARDEAGLVGEGTHERVIVNHASFERGALARKERN